MRRLAAPLLVGLGVFLLTLAVLLPTVVVPRVEKAPLDASSVTVASGTGSYLNPTNLEFVEQDDITVTRVVRGDVEVSGDDVAMYDVSQTVEATEVGEPLNVVTERVLFDRSTGEGTGGTGDNPRHEGAYVVKLPFDTERSDYELWDATAARAYPVSFVGETEVDGVELYQFSGSVPELRRAQQGVPGRLVGAPDTASVFVEEYYTNDRTILVEPRTGSIVGSTSSSTRVWRPSEFGNNDVGQETTIFSAQVETTDETVDQLLSEARDAKSRLDLLGRTLPIVLGLLGLLALVGGLLLLGRRERRAAHARRTRDEDIELVNR